MKLTLFTEELRECLNAAGLSDCGENDEWNYWYQRVLKAHNEAVERQIATEQDENAKLRELVEDMVDCIEIQAAWHRPLTDEICDEFAQRARELGVEV